MIAFRNRRARGGRGLWTALLSRVIVPVLYIPILVFTCNAQQQPSGGQLLMDGLISYIAADYRVAYEILMPLASKKDPIAQLFLGRLFEKGDGAPKDCEAAYYWFSQSATNGSGEAAYDLGTWSESGGCDGKYPNEALKWYKLAEKNGDYRAANKIGELYLLDNGRAVEATFWFKRGAVALDTEALFNLGKLYAEGRVVPKDLIAAYAWFHLAARIESPSNLFEVTKGSIARDQIRELLMPSQVTEGLRSASNFFDDLIKFRSSLRKLDDAYTFARQD